MSSTVLCDISALQWHRTSSLVAGAPLADGDLERMGIPLLAAPKANASEDAKRIHQNLLGTLKGVSMPARVMRERHAASSSPLVCYAEHANLPAMGELTQIGDGLYVTSIERTLLDIAAGRSLMDVALLLFECCGLYAIQPMTARVRAALAMRDNEIRELDKRRRIFAYSDEFGNAIDYGRMLGTQPSWEPCISGDGAITDLWKRPPLLSVDGIRAYADAVADVRGRTRLRRACKLVLPGSASPEESRLALMLTATRKLGGEHVLRPDLNRRVALSPDAAKAVGYTSCVADALWPADRLRSKKSVAVEVEGSMFHQVDGLTLGMGVARDDHARANALKQSGCEVIAVTRSQLRTLAGWEVFMGLLTEKLGLDIRDHTPAFLRQRERLHAELLGKQPPRCVGWG